MQSYYLKDFDHRYAFLHKDSKCSDLKSPELRPDQTALSRMLAYIYALLLHPERPVEVEKEFFPLLKRFFSPTRLTTSTAHLSNAVLVKEIRMDQAEGRHDGLIMFPLFVAETCPIVYNIYLATAQRKGLDNRFTSAAANYFHHVIRSSNAGSGEVIWKDPVHSETKERENSYDNVFLQYVADKYLRYVDANYPYEDSDQSLALRLRFSQVLKDVTDNLNTLTVRDLDVNLFNAWHLPLAGVQVPAKDIEVEYDEVKSNYIDALYFLLIADAAAKPFRCVVTGYSSYQHLIRLATMFPEGTFEIWHREDIVSEMAISLSPILEDFPANLISRQKDLSPVEVAEFSNKNRLLAETDGVGRDLETYIISASELNDRLFITRGEISFYGKMMLVAGSTSLDPALSPENESVCLGFVSLFTDVQTVRGQLMFVDLGVGQEEMLSPAARKLIANTSFLRPAMKENATKTQRLAQRKVDLDNYWNWLSNQYRDPNAWKYVVRKSDGTNSEPVSYDQAIYEYLENSYLELFDDEEVGAGDEVGGAGEDEVGDEEEEVVEVGEGEEEAY